MTLGRFPILDVQPAVDGGRWPAKAVAGERFSCSATVFREGHDALAAAVTLRDPAGRSRAYVPMRLAVPWLDTWTCDVTVTEEGRWTFQVEAWSDPVGSWRHDAQIKVPLGIDVDLMLEEGARLFERAARRVPRPYREMLKGLVPLLRDDTRTPEDRLAVASAPAVQTLLDAYPLREHTTTSARYPVRVERERALFGSWYEFFPRSAGASLDPPRSGTLRAAADDLPRIAGMGFDVVYLPPIHPVGTTNRKGQNNALVAGPGAPGVPWAIGSADGGHDAIDPDLGTTCDFDAFVDRASALGLEVALDLALQVSPDHPWVREHPDWFRIRADGSIAYAENPPKKYQDIYPLDFDRDYEGIYAEVLRVVRFWMGHGVRIFRVDNPHTKPVRFWERLLGEIKATDPDVIFLAEAFTREPMMHTLGKIGFQQSYTYFTWRNTRDELEEYLRELSQHSAAFLRPNFFVNTPDILTEYLQHGGPPAFLVRAVLAATLSPSWGVYSGYELCENTPVRPGSEEYLDSEKYQYRPREYEAAEREGRSIAPFLRRLNEIRHAHRALHRLRNLTFHRVEQPEPHLICYSKRDPGTEGGGIGDTVLVVCNLDPHGAHEASVALDMPALGVGWDDRVLVHDLMTGAEYVWGEWNYVRLEPWPEPAHVFTVRRHIDD
ncbi:MAG: alpha-1,4-glucan--maltose-1-phosphate maltosyltransferase [Streptosporangiales bacterium]